MTTPPTATADFAPGRPVPFAAILGTYRHGSGDPTFHTAPGVVWRTARTPDGPGTLRLHHEPAPQGDRVVAHAWGPGAGWLLAGLPDLLGAADDPSDFEVHHEPLRRVARVHQHWRVARSRLVIDSLVPAIIEQRVTGKQAFGAYRQLVRRYGEPAPGPADVIASLRLMVAPDIAAWRRIPSWEWLRAGVDGRRLTPCSGCCRSHHVLRSASRFLLKRPGNACDPFRASACGLLRRRCSVLPATPMRSALATITWPRTSVTH